MCLPAPLREGNVLSGRKNQHRLTQTAWGEGQVDRRLMTIYNNNHFPSWEPNYPWLWGAE